LRNTSGLLILETDGREEALNFFISHNVPLKVALRVISVPEKRRNSK
jgi:hypothetical protein